MQRRRKELNFFQQTLGILGLLGDHGQAQAFAFFAVGQVRDQQGIRGACGLW